MDKRSEAQVLKAVWMEASNLGMRLFRNNVGLFYTGDGRPTKTGLCKGSSDLIGWLEDGTFAAVEVKNYRGRPSKDQLNFIEQVKKSGGFGCIINDEKKLKKYLDEYKQIKYGNKDKAKDKTND